jgi:hypothetical protein
MAKGERADVVRHHAVRHVLLADILGREQPGVGRRVGDLLDLIEDGREDVGIVVAHLALQNRREALEAHAGVDVLRRQRLQHATLFAVKLNEHHVPNLEAHGVVHVHQARRVAAADAVVVDLRARAAGAHVAHLPEVVRAPEGHHAVRGEILKPDVARLVVRGQALRVVAAEVRGVQVLRRELVHLSEQLPRERDGFLFEKVPERPVPEHLEKSVVVRVLPHVVQVVVLPAGADALLRVDGSFELREGAFGVRLA